MKYFANIFTTSNPSSFDEVLEGMLPTVTEDMNSDLNRPFLAEEVQRALHQMAPLTTLGPDGMSLIFYISFWYIVGNDVIMVILSALNTGVVLESINTTFIALIPKILEPKKVSDFRPISLCNVIYKLIAKVLVNRLKKILPFVVSDTQSAFLSGRLITDNILVAFETLHYLKRKTQGKLGFMALKLDMSKAYNIVEWSFLEKAMLHLGFSERFVKIIMSYVTSVSYSVLLNGELTDNIKPSRGLCQGDPFSPYLFLICAIGLQGLLHKAKSEGHLRGVSICRNGPRVSHLFFADDSVLFCRATEAECQIILDVLSIYEKGSSQKINRDKTCIFFTSNTKPELQTRIQQVLVVLAIGQYEKYLGMPAFVGRAKKQSFIYIKERVWKKLQGWKEKIYHKLVGKSLLNQ